MSSQRPKIRPKIRLFVRGPLNPAGEITLDKDQSHYVQRVMRRKVGDTLLLFNGCDGEWLGRIEACPKNACSVVLTDQTRTQDEEHAIALIFAPIKKARLDFMVEKATELGVTRFYPVFTDYTDAARINTERLQSIAMEAAEQCERLTVPQISEPLKLTAFLEDWPANQPLLFMDESGTGKALPDYPDLPESMTDNLSGILIGPEGGFSSSETDMLGKLPFSSAVTLGPRVLRAETAALSALALWQMLYGDGCNTRPR